MWILITYECECEQSKSLFYSVVIALLVAEYEKCNKRANNKVFMWRAAVTTGSQGLQYSALLALLMRESMYAPVDCLG